MKRIKKIKKIKEFNEITKGFFFFLGWHPAPAESDRFGAEIPIRFSSDETESSSRYLRQKRRRHRQRQGRPHCQAALRFDYCCCCCCCCGCCCCCCGCCCCCCGYCCCCCDGVVFIIYILFCCCFWYGFCHQSLSMLFSSFTFCFVVAFEMDCVISLQRCCWYYLHFVLLLLLTWILSIIIYD